jgi:hypothetical protein
MGKVISGPFHDLIEVERFPTSYPALRFAVAGLALGFFELLSLSRLARSASIRLTTLALVRGAILAIG